MHEFDQKTVTYYYNLKITVFYLIIFLNAFYSCDEFSSIIILFLVYTDPSEIILIYGFGV